MKKALMSYIRFAAYTTFGALIGLVVYGYVEKYATVRAGVGVAVGMAIFISLGIYDEKHLSSATGSDTRQPNQE